MSVNWDFHIYLKNRKIIFGLKLIILFYPVLITGNRKNISQIMTDQLDIMEEFPYIVTIVDIENYRTCGGSYIAPLWILTAAHCLDSTRYRIRLLPDVGKQNRLKIILSLINVGLHYIRENRTSENLFIHPFYIKNPIRNDLGLVKIQSPFPMNNHHYFAKLPSHNLDDINAEVITIKWNSSEEIVGENELPFFTLDILRLNLVKCKNEDLFDMICVGEPGRTPCSGDSGGPMVYKGEVIGVLSHLVGRNCNDTPVYYENVYTYKEWIDFIVLKDSLNYNYFSSCGIIDRYLCCALLILMNCRKVVE